MPDVDFNEITERDYDLDFIEQEAERALQDENRDRLRDPDDIIYWLVQRIRTLQGDLADSQQVLDLLDKDSDDKGECLYCKSPRPGCIERRCGLKRALGELDDA